MRRFSFSRSTNLSVSFAMLGKNMQSLHIFADGAANAVKGIISRRIPHHVMKLWDKRNLPMEEN